MDRTEASPAAAEGPDPRSAVGGDLVSPEGARGSQSKLSATLFFVLLAAVLFRVVTAVTDRSGQTAEKKAPPLIRWVPLEKAAPASAARGRPVLYDFGAEWCLPCHTLDEEGWGDEKIAAIVNEGYLPSRVVDRQREEGKNPPLVDELQRRYAVEAFPTLIVAAADGREIARMEGWGGRSALEKFLMESRTKTK